MNHESKCSTLHGHRYKVEIEATAPDLDQIGRVIDFSVLKERVGSWLDLHWDHTEIIYSEDTQALYGLSMIPRRKATFVAQFNPTAENMADYLLRQVCPTQLAGTGVTVTRIRVWETPNCFAEAKL